MNIPVSDLKRFQKLASHIKGSGVLPVCDYVLFENGKIYKTALDSFIVFDCAEAEGGILVDEKLLYNLLNVTVAPFINIVQKGEKTIISDGRDKIPFQTKKRKEFPAIAEAEGETIELSTDFIGAMAAASVFAKNMDSVPTAYMYLHIGKGSVCAGDGFVGYYYPLDEKVDMILDKKTAQFVSKNGAERFSQSASYYFFYSNDALFGFSKQEIGYMDMVRVINGGSNLTFSASASDIQSFNNLAMQSALKADACVVTMSDGKMDMYDPTIEVEVERQVEGLKISTPFSFNPQYMNTLISGMQSETLDFYEHKNMYWVKSPDSKAISIIAKIQKA